MQPPASWGWRPRKNPVVFVLVGGVLMVLGSALASTFGLVYAFTFPQFMYITPLFTLAATISGIGRIVYTVGFALAIVGVVRAFELARTQLTLPPPASPDAPAAAAGVVRIAPPQRHPSARVVMLGLAVFIVGFASSISGQFIPFVLRSIEGIQAESVTYAVAGVTSAVGTFLILYGIATFLVRRT